MTSDEKKGSFSIEIALLFPVFAFLLFSFIWQMSAVRADMLFKSILVKEAEKVSFYGILGEYTENIYYSLASGTEENGVESDEHSNSEIILYRVYEVALKNQIREHYSGLCKNYPFLYQLNLKHEEYIESDVYGDTINLTSLYFIYTPFKTIRHQFTIPLRLWDHGDGSGKLDKGGNAGNIWGYDNFKRGKILRRRFGGNLPMGFPVLSGFNNGNALVIKSMDLTKPTWSSPMEVQKQMELVLEDLSGYRGTGTEWGEKAILIKENEIRGRYIKFIIPENTMMEQYEENLQEVVEEGKWKGVTVEIIPYQKSL